VSVDNTNKIIIAIIFVTCLIMGALLLFIMNAEIVTNGGGIKHEIFAGMSIGGDGLERLRYTGTPSYTFGGLLIFLIVMLCLLGIPPRKRDLQLCLFLLLTLIFSLTVWYQMINSHLEYLETGVTGYFMGFPTASAWQMYGIWLSSAPLIFLYSIGFRRYVFSDSDEKEFDTLLEKNHSNDQ
jgi:hypothetical protein